MEKLSDQRIACERLKSFVIETFAQKLSAIEVSYYSDRFIIDHLDSLFIKPMEDYEMVISNPDKFDDSIISAHETMLKGYIEKVKAGHLHIFRNSRSTIEKTQLKIVEVRIKGKLSFTISEQELNKALS